MVPVENATGGAAFIAEHKSEGTPNKYTNEVANVKRDTDEQEVFTVNTLEELESTDCAYECKPKHHYRARRLICLNNIAFEFILIHELMYCRAEFFLENLLRAERNILHGEKLGHRIVHPSRPKNMKYGKFLKKVPTVHDVKLRLVIKIYNDACKQDAYSCRKLCDVSFSYLGHKKPFIRQNLYIHYTLFSRNVQGILRKNIRRGMRRIVI